MKDRRKTGVILIGLIAVICLTALVAWPSSDLGVGKDDMASSYMIPVYPGSSLLSRLPERGEANYLSFGSYSEPEEIRRYFTSNTNLKGWKFTGETAGNAGVVLNDENGRRVVIDVKVDSTCLLFCPHLINYWLATTK
ncbi:MAG: hypothetical protein IT488_14760 [Gammaproteobacteria bacterium]|nr:hypothetical protein [Gammaproteobacteria bacterium]